MFWGFLAGGIALAAIEMLTVTFYLAALAASSLLTAFVIRLMEPSPLYAGITFAIFALVTLPLAHVLRRHLQPKEKLALQDMDRGAEVTIESVTDGQIIVRYRDSTWEAIWDAPGQPQPGQRAIIAAREGSRLRIRTR